MAASPSDVLACALMSLPGIGSNPDDNQDWPIYVDYQPDVPDNAICVYDTQGIKEGRLMDGTVVEHPGVQIRIRATDHPTAYNKTKQVQDAIDEIFKLAVSVPGDTNYVIQNCSRVGNPVSLGQEKERTRRLFTINALLTFKEAS